MLENQSLQRYAPEGAPLCLSYAYQVQSAQLPPELRSAVVDVM